jgi:hypothetical protein
MKASNFARLAVGVAVVAATSGFSHPVSPPGGGPPVAVTTCQVLQNVKPARFRPWYGWRYPALRPVPTTDGLRIVFENKTSVPATEVGFHVGYRGATAFVRDVGTFSPGVSIDHTYSEFVDYAYLGTEPNACRAAFVKFADGSEWRGH